MKLFLTLVSVASVAIGYFLQSGPTTPSPTTYTLPLSTFGPTAEAADPDGPYPRVRTPRASTEPSSPNAVASPQAIAPAPPAVSQSPHAVASAPPTVEQITDAVGSKIETLISPVVVRVNKLSGRVEMLEELIGKMTDAVRLTESHSARTLAEYRTELNDLRAMLTELKDTVKRDRESAKNRGPDPGMSKMVTTIDALAETVVKLNRRIDDLKSTISPPANQKKELEPEGKTIEHTTQKMPSNWNTARIEATVMPPCNRGLVTIEINPVVGVNQSYYCPHCRGATFNAKLLSNSPLMIQTSRP